MTITGKAKTATKVKQKSILTRVRLPNSVCPKPRVTTRVMNSSRTMGMVDDVDVVVLWKSEWISSIKNEGGEDR